MRSVDRALALFELFSERGSVLTLSEISRLLGIPVSSCFNLIKSLQAAGYLYEVGAKAFYPTGRLLQTAQVISQHNPAHLQITPQLEALRNAAGETVLLTKQVGHRIIILEILPSAQMIRYDAKVGDFRSLHTSASGKAILSRLPEPERVKAVNKLRLARQTSKTITERDKLLRDIEEGILRGWFVANGEGATDVMAIARPIEIGGSLYSVAMVGPVHRMAPAMTRLAVQLVTRCERINALLRRK